MRAAQPPPAAPPRKRLATLQLLLTDEAFLDAAVAGAMGRLYAAGGALAPWLRPGEPDEERVRHRDEVAAEEAGGEQRVLSAATASLVTVETMAVAAASNLSPKFSRVMVTGWPADSEGCSRLMAFLTDTERDQAAAAAQRAAGAAPPSRPGSWREATSADMGRRQQPTVSHEEVGDGDAAGGLVTTAGFALHHDGGEGGGGGGGGRTLLRATTIVLQARPHSWVSLRL